MRTFEKNTKEYVGNMKKRVEICWKYEEICGKYEGLMWEYMKNIGALPIGSGTWKSEALSEARCESFYTAFSLRRGLGNWRNFKLWDLEKFQEKPGGRLERPEK